MPPAGIEPTSSRPKRDTLSVKLWGRHRYRTSKLDFFPLIRYHPLHCGHGLVAEHVLAKDDARFRLPLAAPGCSTAVVYTLRVRETRVRFSAARTKLSLGSFYHLIGTYCFGALGFEPRIARSQSEYVSRYTMPRLIGAC